MAHRADLLTRAFFLGTALFLARAASALAQGARVEEIIVTAQKKEERIQDVPISMSAFDSEFISRWSLSDVRDLAVFVPNVTMDNNPVQPDFSVRGFGTNPLNKSFEQAVGLVVDGVVYGTVPYFQTALFDVDRIEILRGPQGTLFGKNATAGLFSVVTKNPTDELRADLSVDLGELDRRRIEAAAGGPIWAGVANVRIAGLFDERDGILGNTTAELEPTAPERSGDRERKAFRAKLQFPDVLGAEITLSYERFDIDLVGQGSEIAETTDNLTRFYRLYDPNFDGERGNYLSSTDARERTKYEIDSFVANASTDLLGWGVYATGGYSMLKRDLDDGDADFGPAPILAIDTRDRQPQTTFELRTVSPSFDGLFGLASLGGHALGSSELTVGFFFQRRSIEDSVAELDFDVPVAAQFLAFLLLPEGSTDVLPLESFIGPDVPLGDLLRTDTTIGDERTRVAFEQRATSFAGYAHATWNPTERWSLDYGMRLSHEQKKASWLSTTEQGTGLLTMVALGREPFVQALDRSEFQFTPKVALRYALLDDANLYATWVQGFRAGGFNEFASTGNASELDYEDERVTSYEIGAKSDFLDGTARLNLALFWMTLTDFQLLTQNPGDATFRVDNVGEARARGAELDGMWLPNDWLTLVASLGFDDTEFVDFPIGPCFADRPNTDGDGDARCNFEGEPLERAPKWVVAFTPSVRWPLAWVPSLAESIPPLAAIEFTAGLTVQYKDVQFVGFERDPRVRQPKTFRLDAVAGFANPTQGWSLGFVVQNLTDEFSRFRTLQV
ncbi:MAG: TonB-dependent receptor, partial [Candidatus Binatia bacterium]